MTRYGVLLACLWEVLVIVGQDLRVPVLRDLPTISRIAGRYPLVAVAVLVWLAVHFAYSRSVA